MNGRPGTSLEAMTRITQRASNEYVQRVADYRARTLPLRRVGEAFRKSGRVQRVFNDIFGHRPSKSDRGEQR
jgi:hypothetical protein